MPPKATKPKLAGASSVPKAKSVPSSNRAHGSTPAAAKSKKPKEQAMRRWCRRDEASARLQAMEGARRRRRRARRRPGRGHTLEKAFAERAKEEKLRAGLSRAAPRAGAGGSAPSAIAILPRRASDGLSGLAALDALSAWRRQPRAPAADVLTQRRSRRWRREPPRRPRHQRRRRAAAVDGTGGAASCRRDRARRRWRRSGCRRGIGGEGAAE